MSKIWEIKDSGERQSFNTGAVRDTQQGKGRYDLLPFRTIEHLSKHYEAGCLKYGNRNWEIGMPISRYLDSSIRHLFKFVLGKDKEDGENHLISSIWNLCCLYDTILRVQEGKLPDNLLDLPERKNCDVE